MHFTRRQLSLSTLLSMAFALATASVVAQAQDYPNRPIKLVVPYPPGGATDVIGRVMAQKLSGVLGQQVVVDNRAGAAGSIGAAAVGKSAPDGYTLLMGALTSHSINANLYGAAATGFDIDKSFAPVAVVGVVPLVFVVNPAVKANSLAELIALAKASPGTLSFASAGNGSPQHLAGELFKSMTGIFMVHVPYKGGAPALQEVMGGQVQLMMALVPEAMPLVKAGRLRALAVATTKRLAAYPDVPTVAESGGKDFDMTFWYAFMAPAGTPADIVTKLNQAIDAVLAEKEVRSKLDELSLDVVGGAPAKVTELIKSDSAKWKKVIDDAGIKVE